MMKITSLKVRYDVYCQLLCHEDKSLYMLHYWKLLK